MSVGSENRCEPSSPASNARFDGADGHVEDRGDLGVIELPHVGKDERRSRPFG
jgi:hypothetical protein